MTTEQYDYVVIGGGSAGCVLANRLTASGQLRLSQNGLGADARAKP